MASTTPNVNEDLQQDQESKQQQQQEDLLPLPAPPADGEVQKLDMSSGSAEVKMDHLGPLVVGKDGSLGRIENWDTMTGGEQKNTLRVLGKRNKLRLDALKAQEGESGKSEL